MKNSLFLGSAALLLGAVSAQDYDATVCDEERFGSYSDPRVYLPNAWNDEKDPNGFICMSIDNSTPAFDATWNWGEKIAKGDVHAFPYVRLNDDLLPTRISSIREIKLSVDWTMNLGTPEPPVRSFRQSSWDDTREELEAEGVQTNAAWDFFLDGLWNNTYNPVDSRIEVMVWIGRVGDPHWLGRPGDSETGRLLGNVTLGEYNFGVYYDLNFRNRHVLSAIAEHETGILSFDEDLKPLFDFMADNADEIDDFPEDPFLGIVEFGSEQWLSGGKNVTFTAANFGMELDADPREEGDQGEGGGGGGSGNGDSGASTLTVSISALVGCALVMMSL